MESLVHAMLSNALVATILAVLVAAFGRTCRRPALIHGLWLVVMLKLVTPPIVSVSVPVPITLKSRAAVEATHTPPPPEDRRLQRGLAFVQPSHDEDLAEPTATPLDEFTMASGETHLVNPTLKQAQRPAVVATLANWWEHLLLALVLSGAFAWWTLATVRIVRFQRLLGDVRPIPGDWQVRTEELAERLGLAGCPSVSLVPGRVPPMLWAIGGRPRLLLPIELWSAMNPAERTSLLIHELAHLKRRDHWVRWLELVVAGLYWWHPAAWWIRRGLREAEEQCCDAWVVWAMPRGSKTYATALLAALEFVSGARNAPAAASATSGNGHISCLKRRLRMIIRAKTPKGLSWAGRLTVLGLAVLLLPLAPSWAQNKPDEPKSLDALARPNDVLAKLTTDDDDKDDPKKEEDERDLTEGLESQLKELLAKLGKEIGPATEEVRKSLERAVSEIHKSLEKEGLSGEELAKALDRSQKELYKAFESGGPVDKQVREAIERSRKDAREAMERAREEIGGVARDRAEALRDQARELAERSRVKRDDLKIERDEPDDGEKQPNRQELESARKEIRELEQQLRKATSRLETLQRRESRRNPAARRLPAPPRAPVAPREEPAPHPEPTPKAEPVAPKPPVPPVAPAAPARPARPSARRPQPPDGPPAAGRRAPQTNNDRRLQNLEEKMNQLLKELKDLKSEPKPKESKESSSTRGVRPPKSTTRSGVA